jgi:tripartite ATP-independent transporter DctM subunit
MLTIAGYVRLVPASVPEASKSGAGEVLSALKRCGAVVVLFGCVIGGMYSGVFTATEAAAVGAFGAFLVALLRGKLRSGVFWKVMSETTATTAMVYGLIFGALAFSFFVGITALPEKAMALLGTLHVPSLVLIALLMVVYIILGSIMDSFAVMIITVPIVTPLIVHMGYDLIWWGVVMLIVVETGVITPPFGLNVFVLKSMLPDVPMATIFRGVGPFIVADLAKLVLIVLIPAIVLWLPSTMADRSRRAEAAPDHRHSLSLAPRSGAAVPAHRNRLCDPRICPGPHAATARPPGSAQPPAEGA